MGFTFIPFNGLYVYLNLTLLLLLLLLYAISWHGRPSGAAPDFSNNYLSLPQSALLHHTITIFLEPLRALPRGIPESENLHIVVALTGIWSSA